MIRFVLLIATSLVSPPAQAVPCWAVKKAVAQYGVTVVESWARARGVSDKEIEKAKLCLK
jgi:hypothetical protein